MKTLLLATALVLAFAQPPPQAAEPAPEPAAKITPATTAPLAARVPAASAPLGDREKVIATAARYIGTVEKTGKNDGPEIERWLKASGVAKGDPYCAAFVYAISLEALGARTPFPKTAWSPSMVTGGTAKIAEARSGDAFGIYFSNLKRVGHTGFVERHQGSLVVTIEANTSPTAEWRTAADRDAAKGGGVFRKYRPRTTIYRVKAWLP